MELLDVNTLGFLVFSGFMAAFIDSVVGGGGLISIPALMWTGLPPLTVLGTNKVAAVMGAFTSFVTFVRSGKVDGWLIRRLFPISLLGSAIGVLTVRQIPSEFLRPLVVIMLILVLIYSVRRKNWGTDSTYSGMSMRLLMLSGLVAFAFGFYDGFFGPGTGSFLLFAFLMVGFDFLGAAANARALNFASNIAAAVLFSYFGLVDMAHAIPMGLAMIVGAWCGAHVALSKGAGYVRPLFIIMTTVLIGKQLLELLR
ncbi:TSUP family transporter [Mitsuokella sp.]|uniref:TSUP family transporter n=1 Tax=Mitsuokella TaxID=52225 RepID=UPI0029E2A766|nr:TSUP family transporter [Mitsuokella sp.]MDD6382407.1 TSUP family transporter [Selenomonadaceae bacterium]MDY4474294.1 TSUP family transporter [Mitsuokella sp.]